MTDPSPRRLIGIDFGERRIGVAVSEGSIAVPLAIVEHENRAADLERIAEMVTREAAGAVVVGLPRHMSGDEGEQARRCRRFGDALARRIGVPVLYHDERYTSVRAAESALAVREEASAGRRRAAPRVKRRLDDLAAAAILQDYIDAQERPE